MKRSKSHLNSVGESYFQHMRQALAFTWAMLTASLCCLIHAFVPSVFEKTGSRVVTRLYDRMVVNRSKLTAAPETPDAGRNSLPVEV